MSKPFTYWVRLAFVATLCTLITFSPVSAGRWMDRLLHRDACKAPANACEIPCEPVCIAVPAACCAADAPVVSTCEAAPACGCDAIGGSTPVVHPQPSVPKESTPTVPDSNIKSPIESNPLVQPPKVDKPPVDDAPVFNPPVVTPPVTDPVEPAPIDEPKVTPPKLETPAVAPPVDEPKVDEPPVVEPPVVDEPMPDKAPADDLFGNDAEPAPEPEMPAQDPLPADDLFNDAPADKPADAQPADDLFGNDPVPANEQPAGNEPMPDEGKQPGDLDDLFNDGEKPAPAPAEPADEMPADAQPAEPGLDDLFNGADEPKDGAADKKDPDLDDLFGKPVSSDSIDDESFFKSIIDEGKPANDDPAVKEDAESLDSLFGAFKPTAPFNGAEFKTWVDNTGAYQVKARLSMIYSDKVKLLKENGKFTTVPLARLSEEDFGYVQWVASNLTGDSASKLVKKDESAANADVTR